MDYHLDWLYGALFLASHDEAAIYLNQTSTLIPDLDKRMVSGNQEDIDLLVGFELDGICHLLILEAKGVTGWSNSQLLSKARRLEAIFGQYGQEIFPNVQPHFAILSPYDPPKLDSSKYPVWMLEDGLVRRIPLKIPAGLKKMARCDASGKPKANGDFGGLKRVSRAWLSSFQAS